MLRSGKHVRAVVVSAVISIVLGGAALTLARPASGRAPGPRPEPSMGRGAARPPGFSVDHLPAGALGPLIDFARCMRRHRVADAKSDSLGGPQRPSDRVPPAA
jgi:hypothetical protein